MNNRGRLIVVPNEEQILQESFEWQVKQEKSHTFGLQKFSDTYNLGYQFEEDDYHQAPCDIAESGHMVIKTDEDASLVIFYLPERVTDRQYNYIYNHQSELSSYMQVNGYSLRVEENIIWNKVHGIHEIMREVMQKNLLSSSGVSKSSIR